MAYVIAVCGAGGKTTFCKSKARQLAIDNKKVCITTTTNMWFESDVQNNYFNISEANTNRVAKDIEIKHNRIYYAGNIDEKKRNSKNKITNTNQSQCASYINPGYNSNNCRKIIYEKINIINNSGEGKKYIKGPSIIRNIRGANFHRQCQKEAFKCQNSLKINKHRLFKFKPRK